MGRRGPAKPTKIPPDPLYQNQLVARLVNKVMRDGKKTVAQRHVYRAFRLVEKKTKNEPLKIF